MPPTTMSLLAMMFAVSRHVMKRAMQMMNRQLMAVESYNRVVSPGRRAVVLLSGGLDSTTALALARREGFDATR